MAQEEVGLSTGTVIGSSNQLPNIASKYSMGMGSCNTGVFESGHATGTVYCITLWRNSTYICCYVALIKKIQAIFSLMTYKGL